MKKIILLLFALFLAGCIQQSAIETPEENTTATDSIIPKKPVKEGISLSTDKENKFKLTDFPFADNLNPFSDGAGGSLGKNSTAYIRIDTLDFLGRYDACGEDEYQSMWITPKNSNGKGSILESVYLAEFKGRVGKCRLNNSRIYLLGKEYEILEINAPIGTHSKRIVCGGSLKLRERNSTSTLVLSDGAAFKGDDRWSVILGWQNKSLRKIIIYLDEHIHGLNENCPIVPLFNAENRVTAHFAFMYGQPSSLRIDIDNHVPPEREAVGYNEYLHKDPDYLMISFAPRISEYLWANYRTDSQKGIVNISGKEWIFLKLNSSSLLLGKEKESDYLLTYSEHPEDALNISSRKVVLDSLPYEYGEEYSGCGANYSAAFCKMKNGSCTNRFEMNSGEMKKIGDEYLRVWSVADDSRFPVVMRVHASVFSEIVELNSSYLIFYPVLGFPNKTEFKAIKISKTDPLYKKLTGKEFVIQENATTISTLFDHSASRSYTEQEFQDANNYRIVFSDFSDDFGIPVCTRAFDSYWSCENSKCKKIGTNYANCTYEYRTAAHRLNFSFLGGDWLVTEMTSAKQNLTNESLDIEGGRIKLAKEIIGGILDPGENLTFDSFGLFFDGAQGVDFISDGINFSVYDSRGNLLRTIQGIKQGETQNISINGKKYKIHVWKIGLICPSGYRWVDLSILSDEITLEHGKTINLNNQTWNISLEWKNKGASKNDTKPDHLRSISLCRVPCLGTKTFIIEDRVLNKDYTGYEYEDDDKLQMTFDPAIPENNKSNRYGSDRHNLVFNISGNSWAIAKLNRSALILGKEKENAMLYRYFPGENNGSFNVSGKKIALKDLSYDHMDELLAGFCEVMQNSSCIDDFPIAKGESKKIGEEYLHVWATAWTWPRWVQASVFTDIIELNSTYLEFEDSNQTALKSITIPKNSSVYQKLFGNKS